MYLNTQQQQQQRRRRGEEKKEKQKYYVFCPALQYVRKNENRPKVPENNWRIIPAHERPAQEAQPPQREAFIQLHAKPEVGNKDTQQQGARGRRAAAGPAVLVQCCHE